MTAGTALRLWETSLARLARRCHPRSVLVVGFGTGEEWRVTCRALVWPGLERLAGLELDEQAMRAAAAVPVGAAARLDCADAAELPSCCGAPFDLIVVRRPDLFAQPSRWRLALRRLADALSPGGHLHLSLLAAAETEAAGAWLEAVGLAPRSAVALASGETVVVLWRPAWR